MKRSPILMLAGPTLLASLIALGLLWNRSSSPLPMRDFPEYWSAASAFLNGRNPYDPQVLLDYQRQCDSAVEQPMMMWNPPWTFLLVAPLGFLPPALAHAVWLLIQFAVVLISVGLLLHVYEMPKDGYLIGFVAALIFAPLFLLIWYGQIGGLGLLGLAGFLWFLKRDRPVAAGAFAALTALKPHLLFAFGLMLLLDAIVSRRSRRVLLGGVLAVSAAVILAWLVNPMIFTYYSDSIRAPSSDAHVSVRDWQLPLLSFQLRMLFETADVKRFWVQFVPTLVTCIMIAVLWLRSRQPCDLFRQTPRLVLVSVIAAAYGAWMFDLVVLLVPVIQATVWLVKAYPRRKRTILLTAGLFAVLNLGSSLGPTFASLLFNLRVDLPEFWFFSLAVLGLYLLAGRITTSAESA